MTQDPRSVDVGEFPRLAEDALLALSRLRIDDQRPSDRVLRRAGEIVADTLRVSRVGVWLLVDDGRAIRCEYLYQKGRVETCEGTILHAADFPAYFAKVMTSRVVRVTDVAHDVVAREFRDAYLGPLGISSMLDAPIYRGGRVVGIVCHEHTGPPRDWSDDECEFAGSVGDIAGRLCEEAARRRLQYSLDVHQAQSGHLRREGTLGRFAAGIAHDFNNILGAAMGCSSLIRDAAAGSVEVRGLVDRLDTVIESGRRLTAGLLAYARDDAQRPRVVDLAEILRASQATLQMAAGPGIAVAMAIGGAASHVFVDPVEIERLLLNLTVNARDASRPGGTITITLSEATPPAAEGGHGSSYALIEVRDAGTGMDAATRARVLEPYFSTKGASGSGLGLAIVNQAVTRAGGLVDIQSEVGRGTAVRVFLPSIEPLA